MGTNRLHKLWSIFERVNGLIESKVMLEENKPLWHDVYKRFPPKLNPHFSQPAEMVPIKPIFYPEDNLRAELHNLVPNIVIDLQEKSEETFTVKCQELINKGSTVHEAIKRTSHVTFSSEGERDNEDKDIYVVNEVKKHTSHGTFSFEGERANEDKDIYEVEKH